VTGALASARCLGCGGAFQPLGASHVCCSAACRRRWAHRRRRSPAEPAVASFWDLLLLVHRRDRGRCGVCRQPLRLDLPYRHPESATLDHVVAVSHGGGDELVNLEPTHWACNRRKGNR